MEEGREKGEAISVFKRVQECKLLISHKKLNKSSN
jgi:hypothetical protein